MRVHHFRHVEFENLGSIHDWLEAKGHRVTTTRMYAGDPFPTMDQFDGLIVMGGPMSANDESKLPWIVPEKKLIKAAIEAGKPVLGVCLGSQLIASVLGSKVYPNREREIGWLDIHRTPAAADHPIGAIFPPTVNAFHWHGETFDLPQGAVCLASSAACVNQAYAYGRHVLGLQFHLEMTPELAKGLTIHCADELGPAAYVQTPAQILANEERFQPINRLMDSLLDHLIDGDSSPSIR